MCFTWETADGYGPIWIVGDQAYVEAKEKLDQCPTPDVLVRIHPIEMPNWTDSENIKEKEVQRKKILPMQHIVPDKDPHPHPSYFTWGHLYQRERKGIYIRTVFCANKLLKCGLAEVICALAGLTK